jgi:hypothetical protein
MDELRCPGTMHGRVSEDRKKLEVKCYRRGCGHAPGVVVLHTFDLESGEIESTRRFTDPRKLRKETDGAQHTRPAVRSA